MEKPIPTKIRSYFKPTQEAGIRSIDVEKKAPSPMSGGLLLLSIALAGYAWFSSSLLAATLSGTAFITMLLLPYKKTTIKEEVKVSEKRETQFYFEYGSENKVSWGIYDDRNLTVFADFADGLIYFSGPATKSTHLSDHIFSLYNLELRNNIITKKEKTPLEVVSHPTFASGNALVDGRVVPMTVQTGYKSYTTGGDYVTAGKEITFRLFSARHVKDVSSGIFKSMNTMINKNNGKVFDNEDKILTTETDTNGNITNHTPLSATLTDEKFKSFCERVEKICLEYSASRGGCEFRDGLVRIKEK